MILNINKEIMKRLIINSSAEKLSNPFYWYASLDYSKEISFPEHIILNMKVAEDIKKIEEALYIINKYESIGVNFTENI